MRRLMMVCFLVCFSMAFVNVMDVQACSGLSYDEWPLDAVLTKASEPGDNSLIVVGRVHIVSDSTINAILHIDRVLKGDLNNEFVVFSRNDPTYILEERHQMSCITFGEQLVPDKRFIAGLQQDSRGSYGGRFFLEDTEGQFTLQDPTQPEETLSFDYEGMIAYALQLFHETAYTPQNRTLPRVAAVRLYTKEGKNTYILTIDRMTLQSDRNLVECNPFLAFSCGNRVQAENGIDTATFYPVNPLDEETGYRTGYYLSIEGETGVFSDHSDALMVWAGQELRLYTNMEQYPGGASALPPLLRTLLFNPDDSLIPGAGAWSPNGRTFAFSRQSGVWLWDAFMPDSQPSLFLPVTDAPILVRAYSPGGNYMALESKSRRYHVDVATLQEYPDGVFSEHDRRLAAYDTTAKSSLIEIYEMPQFELLGKDVSVSQFEWIDEKHYVMAACGDPIYPPEMAPGFQKPWCKVLTNFLVDESIAPDGIFFDYDPITQSIATLVDEDTITINGEVIELEGDVNSPIIGIELIPVIDLNHRNF